MILIILATLSGLIITSLLLNSLINGLLGPYLKNAPSARETASVSLLIPARNEEDNIATCLKSLQAQEYENLQILVLDDQSEDRTAEIVRRFARTDHRIRLLQGQPLPDGWLGKNWACHQLSEQANGDIFIFTDADTQHHPQAVLHTVGWLQHLHLDMLSAFPQQLTKTLMEKLIVPGIDLILYAFLMLWSTYYLKSARFAAANGQWIAYTRKAYHAFGGHRRVKSEIVEDVAQSRLAKQDGFKMITLAGTGSVFCRMYHSSREVWQGFSKNAFGLTGHNTLLFMLFLSMIFIGCVLPYGLLFWETARTIGLILVAANLFLRGILAVAFKHPFWISIILHPVAVLLAIIIGFNSFFQSKFGHINWKGRSIRLNI
ncbi:MAG: glycosyltransferase [Caldithrix sp.]|nr:glycosyltransferase [Caldithrix sp.]